MVRGRDASAWEASGRPVLAVAGLLAYLAIAGLASGSNGDAGPPADGLAALFRDLEGRGGEFGAGAIIDSTGVASGPRRRWDTRLFAYADLTLDLASLLSIPGTSLYVQTAGEVGPNGQRASLDLQGTSSIDARDHRILSALWVEHRALDDRVRVKLGKLDASAEFAAPVYGLLFSGGSYGLIPVTPGFPTYPDPAFGAESQVIVGELVTNNAADSQHLKPVVERIEENLGALPRQLSADTGYCSEANLETLSDLGIDAYIPTERITDRYDQKRVTVSSNTQVQRRPASEARSCGGGADPDVRCNDLFCVRPRDAGERSWQQALTTGPCRSPKLE